MFQSVVTKQASSTNKPRWQIAIGVPVDPIRPRTSGFYCRRARQLPPQYLTAASIRLVTLDTGSEATVELVKPPVSDFPPEETTHINPIVWVAAAAGVIFALFKLGWIGVKVEAMSAEKVLEEIKAKQAASDAPAASQDSAVLAASVAAVSVDASLTDAKGAAGSKTSGAAPVEVLPPEEQDLGRIILCASTTGRQDSDVLLREFHEELHGAYREHLGMRVTGLLVVYPNCVLHMLEGDCHLLFDLLRRLLPTRQFYHGLRETRVVSFEPGISSRLFSSWQSHYMATTSSDAKAGTLLDADRWVASVKSLKSLAVRLGRQLAPPGSPAPGADDGTVQGGDAAVMTTARDVWRQAVQGASDGKVQQQQQQQGTTATVPSDSGGSTSSNLTATLPEGVTRQLPLPDQILSLAVSQEGDTVETFLDMFDWDYSPSGEEDMASSQMQKQPEQSAMQTESPLAKYYPKPRSSGSGQ